MTTILYFLAIFRSFFRLTSEAGQSKSLEWGTRAAAYPSQAGYQREWVFRVAAKRAPAESKREKEGGLRKRVFILVFAGHFSDLIFTNKVANEAV